MKLPWSTLSIGLGLFFKKIAFLQPTKNLAYDRNFLPEKPVPAPFQEEDVSGWQVERVHVPLEIIQFDDIVIRALEKEDPLGVVDFPRHRSVEKGLAGVRDERGGHKATLEGGWVHFKATDSLVKLPPPLF